MVKKEIAQPLLGAAADEDAALHGDRAKGHAGEIFMTEAMASELLLTHGFNEISEKKKHPLLKLLGYFMGPIPWLMEAACLISLVLFIFEQEKHATDADPATWIVLLLLLLVNGFMGFKEESSAGSAIDALKASLAPLARVRRDGKFIEKESRLLVPGDVVILKGGDIVPADCKLHEGEPMEVDQSALTGESLPVTAFSGDLVYSGSIIKRGELHATVVSTGSQTFFGKAAALVGSVQQAHSLSGLIFIFRFFSEQVGHLQKILLKIAYFLMATGIILVSVLFAVLLAVQHRPWSSALVSCLVLLVASIPIAMQVVPRHAFLFFLAAVVEWIPAICLFFSFFFSTLLST